MPDPIEEGCARIFRDVISAAHPINTAEWGDARLLAEPFEMMDVDSLTLLDFVMQVEDAYGIELDETAFNRCRTLADLAALVATAKNRKAAASV